ncbi:unnamed protein product [Schistosoma margrebowiei]|uniref:NADH:ubiquinone oxidoreductase intermediate-associated protein 30 domain-containing protein n=1 Tax=Schistosoma margrebowiei TaxID=48269 RepID=A0AA85A0I8_9TREM|nr:unnamed protein product [Schistosoma margrebowiei]
MFEINLKLNHLRMMIKNTSVVVLICTTLLMNTHNAMEGKSSYKTYLNRSGLFNKTLFDFTDTNNKEVFTGWTEYSHTAQGSKATLVPLHGQNNQSAIFFYLLNSRSNGSSFAGVHKIFIDPVWPVYNGVVIDLHRKGLDSNFKLMFYGNCQDIQNCVSYESNFKTSGVRQRIELPISRHTQRFHSRQNSIPFSSNLNQVSRFGIQAYTSRNETEEHFGVGSIEIFTISIYKEDRKSV